MIEPARRLLVVTPWWPETPEDPAGSFVRDQVVALRAAGADVRVVVLRPWMPFRSRRAAAPIGDGGGNVGPRRGLRVLLTPWRPYRRAYDDLQRAWTSLVSRAVRIQGPWSRQALVVVHTQELAVPAHRALARRGTNYLVVAHGLEPDSPRYARPARRREYRRALAGAARVVAVGPGLAAALEAESPEAEVRVALNGYDEGRIARALAEPPRQGDGPRLVSVSNLTEGKGIHLVLRALESRAKRGLFVPAYDVVGAGPSGADLETQARTAGIADRVRFHGRLPRDAALRIVRGATAFVLPSAPEACGVAYLEAMALGVAPVAVEGEGPSAFIGPESSGLLVAWTEEAVGRAVDRLLDEEGLSAALGRGAALAARVLGWSLAARAFLDVLPAPAARHPHRDARPWLTLYNEPTPYVTGKLDDVEATGLVSLRRVWLGVDASQSWGEDALHREEDVLDRPTRTARVALDLLRRRYAGLHAGGWGGAASTTALLGAAWLGRVPLGIEGDTHVSRSVGVRAHARRAYLRGLDRRVVAWMPGGTPQAEHLARVVAPRAPVVVERMTTDTKTLLAEADRLGPEAGRRWREAHGIPSEASLALYVGRISPEKGIGDFIDAAGRLVREGRDLHVALVGPGTVDPAAASLVPGARLHATGRVPWRALVPAYLAADVLVLPSRFEPWGLVVHEALLLGCPVVVTDAVGCARDLVAGPGSGLVVPAGDAEAIASGVRSVLDAGGRGSDQARRGRRIAREWSREGAAGRVAGAMAGPHRPHRSEPC